MRLRKTAPVLVMALALIGIALMRPDEDPIPPLDRPAPPADGVPEGDARSPPALPGSAPVAELKVREDDPHHETKEGLQDPDPVPTQSDSIPDEEVGPELRVLAEMDLYDQRPDFIKAGLRGLSKTQLLAHEARVLELLGHEKATVRRMAAVALAPILDQERVRDALFEQYMQESDLAVKATISRIWNGSRVGSETVHSWEICTSFLQRLWEFERNPEAKWCILDGYVGLDSTFPDAAVERLRTMLDEGLPPGPPPSCTRRNLEQEVQSVLEHHTPTPK